MSLARGILTVTAKGSARKLEFSKQFRVGLAVTNDDIDARVKNGLLRITVQQVAREAIPEQSIPVTKG